ncbi:MAG: hypothetical protein JEY94_16630 [Melioribacteraceae bacterium]|nr:hypothetical protein [Melioribacteraceae bacterium]
MKKVQIQILIILIIAVVGCQKSADTDLPEGVHKGVVLETKAATSYTYVKVEEDGKEIWLAVRKSEIADGTTIYYAGELEMKNFQSKDLDLTFDSIYFVQNFASNLDALINKEPEAADPHMGAVKTEKKELEVATVKDGKTIEQIYAEKETLANKKIKVSGEVVKYSASIMGKNWLHLQDGTGGEKTFDLTINTSEVVKVGDKVTLEGVLAVNKDFGAGYKYEVIIEDAKLVK